MVKGSGEVLIAARLVALATWLVAANVPPINPANKPIAALSAPNTPAAKAAPAGIRITVCTTSHNESRPGTLSAKNSTATMKPLPASTTGCASKRKPSGSSTQPRYPAMPVNSTTRYKRIPLAQPKAPASAISCAVSSVCIAAHYIRNTPNLVSGIGALSDADKPSASTRRVSAGSMMPSSHRRAVAK